LHGRYFYLVGSGWLRCLLATKSIYALGFVSPTLFSEKVSENAESLINSGNFRENNLQDLQICAGNLRRISQ
jgi:hypothetical protein